MSAASAGTATRPAEHPERPPTSVVDVTAPWLADLPRLERPLRFVASFASQHHEALAAPDAVIDHGSLQLEGLVAPDGRLVLSISSRATGASAPDAASAEELAWDGTRAWRRPRANPGWLVVDRADRPPVPPRAAKLGMLLQHTDAFGELAYGSSAGQSSRRVAPSAESWKWCDRATVIEEGPLRTLVLDADGKRFTSRFRSTLSVLDGGRARLTEYRVESIPREPAGGPASACGSIQFREVTGWRDIDGHPLATGLRGGGCSDDQPGAALVGVRTTAEAVLREAAFVEADEFEGEMAEFLRLRPGERLFDSSIKLVMREGDRRIHLDGVAWELAEPLTSHPGERLGELLRSAVKVAETQPPPRPSLPSRGRTSPGTDAGAATHPGGASRAALIAVGVVAAGVGSALLVRSRRPRQRGDRPGRSVSAIAAR
ncbi:MAG TPA: hypothetical protein PKC43_00245 [Phycisphaerales bacterium]|nr:hypothetical protein [Phycisphaerales bacterium]HMP35854.1 hypothetical protein [Phycisphaerales bacterium]